MSSIEQPPGPPGPVPDPVPGPVPPGTGRHQLVRLTGALHDAVDRATAPEWSMTPDEQREVLVGLHRLESRLAELRGRVLLAGDRNDIGAKTGAASTPAWYADAIRGDRRKAYAELHLAEVLDRAAYPAPKTSSSAATDADASEADAVSDVAAEDGGDADAEDGSATAGVCGGGFAATRGAFAAGEIDATKARIITGAVTRLTEEHEQLPAGTQAKAEAHLLDLAREFDPRRLRIAAKRLFEVVCPEAADAEEGRAVAKEEEAARRRAYLSLRDNGDGTTEGRFRLPTLHAEILTKALQALTSPRRLGEDRIDPETDRPLRQSALFGRGLIELLESHLNLETLPTSHGSPFTLVVTIPLQTLTSGLGVAVTETGTPTSAGQARRLACTAGIIPLVLGGDSMPLDIGRERRLHTRYQRIAMNQRDAGCRAAGCDRPPSFCEAHHLKPWSRGGPTTLDDGILLCPPHHHMADHPQAWDMTHLPDGTIRFRRRQ